MAECEAFLPAQGRVCGQPATGTHVYACVHEHVVVRSSCDEHRPEPGMVGCRQCLAAGHECGMTFRPAGDNGPGAVLRRTVPEPSDSAFEHSPCPRLGDPQ